MNIILFLFFMLLGCTGSSSTKSFLTSNRLREESYYKVEDFKKEFFLERVDSPSHSLLKLKFKLLENAKSYYVYSCSISDSIKLFNSLVKELKSEEIQRIKDTPQDDLYIENNYIIYSIKKFEPNMCYKVKVELNDNEDIFSNELEVSIKKPTSQKPFIGRLDLNKISQPNFTENLSFLDEGSISSNSYKNFVDEEVKKEIFRVSLKLKAKNDDEIKEKILSLIKIIDKKSSELKSILNEESYEMDNTPNFLGLNIVANKGLINNIIIPALKEIKNLDIDKISREDLEKTCIKLIILKIETYRVERSPTKSARSRSVKKWNSLKIISLNKTLDSSENSDENIDKDKMLKRGVSENNIFSPR